MAKSGRYCQNCGYELDEESNICRRCHVVSAFNLENYLLSKYKLFTIIGIFGALSVYFSNLSVTNDKFHFLVYASYITMSIVILLSLLCGWDSIFYFKNLLMLPFDGKAHYLSWFKQAIQFSTLLLFFSFFIAVIGFISLYILSNTDIAISLVLTIVLDFFILLLISSFYFPIRSAIEMQTNFYRYIINFFLIFWLFLVLQAYFIKHSDDIFGLLLPIVGVVIAYALLIRSCWLISQTMDNGIKSITMGNFKRQARVVWYRLKKL